MLGEIEGDSETPKSQPLLFPPSSFPSEIKELKVAPPSAVE